MVRELDKRLPLSELVDRHLRDSRRGKNLYRMRHRFGCSEAERQEHLRHLPTGDRRRDAGWKIQWQGYRQRHLDDTPRHHGFQAQLYREGNGDSERSRHDGRLVYSCPQQQALQRYGHLHYDEAVTATLSATGRSLGAAAIGSGWPGGWAGALAGACPLPAQNSISSEIRGLRRVPVMKRTG